MPPLPVSGCEPYGVNIVGVRINNRGGCCWVHFRRRFVLIFIMENKIKNGLTVETVTAFELSKPDGNVDTAIFFGLKVQGMVACSKLK
jgi:hypothetical protein